MFILGCEINGARSIRHVASDKFLGLLWPDGFEPTQFPDEWGMDRNGINFTFIMALLQGEILQGKE